MRPRAGGGRRRAAAGRHPAWCGCQARPGLPPAGLAHHPCAGRRWPGVLPLTWLPAAAAAVRCPHPPCRAARGARRTWRRTPCRGTSWGMCSSSDVASGGRCALQTLDSPGVCCGGRLSSPPRDGPGGVFKLLSLRRRCVEQPALPGNFLRCVQVASRAATSLRRPEERGGWEHARCDFCGGQLACARGQVAAFGCWRLPRWPAVGSSAGSRWRGTLRRHDFSLWRVPVASAWPGCSLAHAAALPALPLAPCKAPADETADSGHTCEG